MLPVNQLGWMAGVLDLKGRIVRKKNSQRRSPQIVLMVETKEFAVVRGLSNLTGTNPELMTERKTPDWMRRSCSEHCPEAHVHVTARGRDVPASMPPIARWTITGAGAGIVLYNVIPFLLVDRGFQEAMVETVNNSVIGGQGSSAIIHQIIRLGNIGWELPEKFRPVYHQQGSPVLELAPAEK